MTATTSSANVIRRTATTTPGHTMAMVAYLLTWVTGLIVLFTTDKTDKYTRFHAIQAIGLGIAVTGLYLVWNVFVMGMMVSGSLGLYAMLNMISLLVWLGTLAVVILCAVKAYQGTKFMLPVVGPFAEKNA